jgi:small-conductance mechanosensitive channel
MKKLIILTIAACTAVLTAKAVDSYLYWMVDVSDNANYAFNYATIKGIDSKGTVSDYLSFYGSGSSDALGTKVYSTTYTEADSWALGTTTGEGAFTGVDGYGAGSKFLVELWADGATQNDAASRIAYGYLAYADVMDSIYKTMGTSGASAFVVGASQLVPEPTSGLLAILGFAALALRRKQKKA